MLRAEKLSLARSARDLFVDLDWLLDRGDRVGLVGPNGAGKSSLMRVLAGEIAPDSGSVHQGKGERVGYLPQDGIVHEGRTVQAEALAGMITLHKLQAEVDASLEALHTLDAADPRHDKALHSHEEAESSFRALGGYSMTARVTRVLRGLGFTDADLSRDCGEFSGGWQMRIALAKLLLEAPDVLLLDEPTNHLDIEARTWLEHFLSLYPGAVVLVSHDRTFLDKVGNKVCELSGGVITNYNGTFSAYLIARVERVELLRKKHAEQQEEIQKQELFIRRFRATASKASVVQSRIKALEKVERIVLPASEERIRFKFPPAPRSGGAPLALLGGQKRYGKLDVLRDAHVTVARGERLCLAGPNGAGKSTLLRLLAGREALDAGELVRDRAARVAYFAQDQVKELRADDTVLDAVQVAAPHALPGQLRSLLGAFLFRGDDVYKKCSVLSGGERNRVALARVLLLEANVLLLDEPTNHLDLQGKESLREALSAFDGAVIFVSHDRDFVSSLATSVIEVGGGDVKRYELGFEAFLWKRALDLGYQGTPLPGVPGPDLWFLRGTDYFEEEAKIAALATLKASKVSAAAAASAAAAGLASVAARAPDASTHSHAPKPSNASKLSHEERRRLQRKVESLKKKIALLETQSGQASSKLAELDGRLASPEVAKDHGLLWTLVREREATVLGNERLTSEWEAAMVDLESAEAELV